MKLIIVVHSGCVMNIYSEDRDEPGVRCIVMDHDAIDVGSPPFGELNIEPLSDSEEPEIIEAVTEFLKQL